MADDARIPDDPAGHLTQTDVGQLRAILGFPDSIATTDTRDRHSGRREHAAVSTASAPDTVPAAQSVEDLRRRLDHLTVRVEATAGLVESLLDRLDSSATHLTAPLTAEELGDIAARMVRVIETRLETHTERLEEVIGAQGAGQPQLGVVHSGDSADLRLLDDHLAMIGRAVLDMKQSFDALEQSPSKLQEMTILAHVDRWFEETNARLETDVDHARREMHRFDVALAEIRAAMADLPDRQALQELQETIGPLSEHANLSDLYRSISELPERVALQQPIARLDAAILQQVDGRLEEMGTQISQKLEDQLAARVQRFEALSQAMIALVNEPIDTLTAKLSQLAKDREPTVQAARSIAAIERAQADMTATLDGLRQEGLERDAMLRQLLDKHNV